MALVIVTGTLTSWHWLAQLILLFTSSAVSNALFVQPPYRIKSYPALKLSVADRLGVPYQSVAYDAGKAASFPGFALSLDAKFGELDEPSFNALQKAYCAWSETKSRVKWQAGRKYRLIDFLPPLLQAVSGLHFRSSRTKQKGLPSFLGGPDDKVKRYADQEVLLTTNCWGFAWEVLFQADNADTSAMTISTADPTSAWREFTGPGFDLIQSSRTQPQLLKDSYTRNRKLKGGDVLLVWHQNPSTASGEDLYLDHVATVIDDDVYFEKSGSGDRVPFRVSTWDMLVANFPPSVFFWEWRRLVRNNPLSPTAVYGSPQTRLRPAPEIFGIDAQVASRTKRFLQDRFSLLSKLRPSVAQTLSLQADTGEGGVVEAQVYTGILVLEELVFDKETGRASLPMSAFMPVWYMTVLKMMPKNTYI
jgi:hypothetical protein